MTLDPQANILDSLKQAGIIRDSHYRRALAHPMFGELATYSDPAHYLTWLVFRDIMTEDQLKAACAHVAATCSGEQLERYNEMLGSALGMLEDWRGSFNRQWFDELVAEKLISPEERDEALEQASAEHLLASPAAALAWMALTGQIDDKRLGASGDGRRGEILAEAKEIHDGTEAAARSAIMGAIFPGPRWLWIAAPVLLVAFVVWTIVKPVAVPTCTDPDIARTIDGMMLRASIDARTANPLLSLGKKPSVPTVQGIKEVGFASETGVRGCTAMLKFDEGEVPYAFTIGPSKDKGGDDDGFRVTGAEPAIAQARYGNLDAKGAFLHKAEPVGRAEVERAFQEGVARIGLERASLGRERQPEHALSTRAPERTREIAEIEPTGPCREVRKDTAYSCPLLVERNDALLASIGAGSGMLVDSAFTFERDSATGPWRVSADFADEYMTAVARARFQAVKAGQVVEEARQEEAPEGTRK